MSTSSLVLGAAFVIDIAAIVSILLLTYQNLGKSSSEVILVAIAIPILTTLGSVLTIIVRALAKELQSEEKGDERE